MCQCHRDRNKKFSGKEKQRKIEHMGNYYLANKKNFLRFYEVVWKLMIPNTNFRIAGNILKYKKYFFSPS